MMRNLFLALLFCFCIFTTGCSGGHGPDIEKQEIVRLFMHRVGHFSVMVQSGNELKQVDLNFGCCDTIVNIVCDVPLGKSMWFEKKGNKVTVHIHGVGSVEGGGFKPNKGVGQTVNVIE